MKVLLLGSGGREHALAWRLARSKRLQTLYILPGNAGTSQVGINVPGDASDVHLVLDVVRREHIDLVIVGPEDPLATGVVDALQTAGVRTFGPRAAVARLETDKAYAKQLMRQHAIPTAEARVFSDYRLAREFIASREEALVVKACGLARGKGAIVCDDPADAILAAENMLVRRVFGDAGASIVVEERLLGKEASLMAVVSGRAIYLLEPAQDYKRLSVGDQGPNTGGMGSVCPTGVLSAESMRQVETQILVPTLNALVRDGLDYIGVLYVGLMLTPAGPKVLEFNCRFGDPEAQVLMMRLRSDLLELLDAAVQGRLEDASIEWDPRPAVCVVAASGGYPESSVPDRPITGLDGVPCSDELMVFHAGTRRLLQNVVTAGGRVLGVTALGNTIAAARERVYSALDRIRFEGMQYRTDIGA